VLVVTKSGRDAELIEALQPFHEFECTGNDDEYVQDIDVSDDEGMVEDLIENGKAVFDAGRLDFTSEEAAHKYGYVLLERGTYKVLKAVDRTNPNKKWDGWKVGGRWTCELIDKDGKGRNTLCVKDIDLDAISEKRIRAMRAMRADCYDMLEGETEEAYMERKCPGGFYLPFYAVLHDGEWKAKGEMGWWGMSRDMPTTEGELSWSRKVEALIKSLPSACYLTVVDCHI
jgi:hypothetical protein